MLPNILYLHSHDTGRYVQPYGYPVPTPHLQAFAEQATVFRNAHCAGPTCSPSRAALLTGMCCHSAGMLGLAHRGFAMPDYSRTLPNYLQKHGYSTTLCGIQHIVHGDNTKQEAGWQRVLEADTDAAANRAEAYSRAAADFIRGKPKGPFFLDVGFFETHRVFPEAGPENDAKWKRAPAIFPDTPRTRQDWAEYCQMAQHLDTGYGRILDALDEAGLAENTLVIITTDHGVPFPDMKCNLTDHGTGVLLMMRGPAGPTSSTSFAAPGGRVLDALVSHIDLFPTLCGVLGTPVPDYVQGRSFLPVVRGEVAEVNDHIFAEVTYHAAYEPQRGVRTHRHKYIRRFEPRDGRVLTNVDGGPARDEAMAYGWHEQPPATEQFYDLLLDPAERENRIDDPACAGERDRLRKMLDDWMIETNDPLLAGPVPLPPGAVANSADGLNAGDPPEHSG
ncbi:MAG: sulfatase [Phycisphaerae bacterium]